MPTTSRGYHYPAPGDAPNGPLQIGQLAQDVDDDLAGLGAWTAYSTLWTATGVDPSIGNGTRAGRYRLLGKECLYTGRIIMGSTTTYGSGVWLISLPVPALSAVYYDGVASCSDSSTPANRSPAACVLSSTTTMSVYCVGGSAQPAVPFTWASGDELRWTITYEVA